MLYASMEGPGVQDTDLQRHSANNLSGFVPSNEISAANGGYLHQQGVKSPAAHISPLSFENEDELNVAALPSFYLTDRTGVPRQYPLAEELFGMPNDTPLSVVQSTLMRHLEPDYKDLITTLPPQDIARIMYANTLVSAAEIVKYLGCIKPLAAVAVAAQSPKPMFNQFHTLAGTVLGAALVEVDLRTGFKRYGIEPVIADTDGEPGLFPEGLLLSSRVYLAQDIEAASQG